MNLGQVTLIISLVWVSGSSCEKKKLVTSGSQFAFVLQSPGWSTKSPYTGNILEQWKVLGVGPKYQSYLSSPKWFQCATKVENRWVRRSPRTFQPSTVPTARCTSESPEEQGHTARYCQGPLQPKSIGPSEYQGPDVTFNTLQVIPI